MFKNNKSKLLMQVLPALYIVIFITSLLCIFMLGGYSADIMLNFKRQEVLRMLEPLASELENTEHAKWYVDYWMNHYEEMEIDLSDTAIDNYADAYLELYEVYKAEYGIDIDTLIVKEIVDSEGGCSYQMDYSGIDPEVLSPKSQNLFAKMIYYRLAADFDSIKQGSNLKHVYCAVPIEGDGDQAMYIFSGKRDDELYGTKKDNIYTLGTIGTISREKYPSFYETFETGEVIKKEALFVSDPTDSSNTGSIRCHFYVPVCDDEGNTLCVIAVSDELDNIKGLIKLPLTVMMIMYLSTMVFCAIIVAHVLKHRAIVPINTMQKMVKEYGETKDGDKLRANMGSITVKKRINKNEIGVLAGEIADMSDELSQYIEDVKNMTSKHERLSTELDLATKIQRSALLEDFDCFPRDWNISVCGSMDPAKEVGGDFYDFVQIDDDHVAFIIGDVSGKGIPASLLMMISMTLFRNEISYGKDPGIIMGAVNRALCTRNFENMFVTAWIGILEISTGIVKTANAGHENPVIKRKDGSVVEIKGKHGLVLAGMDGVKYETSEIHLSRGDVLMVYTDGVPEAINIDDEQYGVDRLKKCLILSNASTPKEYIEDVILDMNKFVQNADQFDDTTMLVISY